MRTISLMCGSCGGLLQMKVDEDIDLIYYGLECDACDLVYNYHKKKGMWFAHRVIDIRFVGIEQSPNNHATPKRGSEDKPEKGWHWALIRAMNQDYRDYR